MKALFTSPDRIQIHISTMRSPNLPVISLCPPSQSNPAHRTPFLPMVLTEYPARACHVALQVCRQTNWRGTRVSCPVILSFLFMKRRVWCKSRAHISKQFRNACRVLLGQAVNSNGEASTTSTLPARRRRGKYQRALGSKVACGGGVARR